MLHFARLLAILLVLAPLAPARACQTCDAGAALPGDFAPLTSGDSLRLHMETGFSFQRISPSAQLVIEALS